MSGDAEDDDDGGRGRRVIALAIAAVPALAALVTIVITLFPSVKPCLGDTDASFTGAPVFPKVRFHDHLIRNGTPKEELAGEPNVLGSEVRFSYRTSGYRGATLTVTWSLVAIERDETLGAVVPGQDRAVALTFTPEACSEGGGKDLFVTIPAPGRRYRVVLELYRDRDPNLGDRIALTETEPFRG
jgi:hypothetical protein